MAQAIRVPALQAQSPKFKSQSPPQKEKGSLIAQGIPLFLLMPTYLSAYSNRADDEEQKPVSAPLVLSFGAT
jgi:hypothetical protein